MQRRRSWLVLIALAVLATGTAAPGARADAWAPYLDYAYIYSSADPAALGARLDEYAREAGTSLEQYVENAHRAIDEGRSASDPDTLRRLAIGELLIYLSTGEPQLIEDSARTVHDLEPHRGSHENRYWYHYVLSHHALEKGRPLDFVDHLLALWVGVITPLETPYEALQALSLSDSPNSGFVSALPYVYENVSRIILIRSQEMGIDRDLDPLGAVVRMLADGRVGAQPEVIPPDATSRAYLERIVRRLDGPNSDAGSLTFTLALFEASKYHDQSRGLLASEGLSEQTVRAIRVASGAYESALDRANTVQGQAAVYTRVLRQIGEIYAAKQRLGVDPEIPTPFTVSAAIGVYATLQKGLLPDHGWEELGFRADARDDYIASMHALWEEIQEASLNAADYYLARSVEHPHLSHEYTRNAARINDRYLDFFHKFATETGQEAVPDSAYFAAYEAARGSSDALLVYSRSTPTSVEIDRATMRTVIAMKIFPFDRSLWPGLSAALARQGRENQYLTLVSPIAEALTKSRHVNAWIDKGEPGSAQIEVMRRALSDTQVIMHLGFAEAESIEDLDQGLVALRERRAVAENELRAITGGDAPPASPAAAAEISVDVTGREQHIADLERLMSRLDDQIRARTRVLPVYRAALETEGLAQALRSQRDHPVHVLLRRMHHENQG